MRAADVQQARREFEGRVTSLCGRHIHAVTYWDVHNWGPEPRAWDYGDWHHAVMGVELGTDEGPVSIIWSNVFFPYGVDVYFTPMSDHLNLVGPEGPEGWAVTDAEPWRSRTVEPGAAILAAAAFWETFDVGPGRNRDGQVVSPSESHDVPVGLRLDVGDKPVWFVAGQPNWPDTDDVLFPGDEIMVVFSRERMLRIGFPTGSFLDLENHL